MSNIKKLINKGLVALTCSVLLAACGSGGGGGGNNSGGGGGGNNTTPSATSLIFSTPNIVPSLDSHAITAYLVATNNTDQNITGVTYTISNRVGELSSSNIILDPNNCSTVNAHSNCTIDVTLPAGFTSGTFMINATNGVAATASINSIHPNSGVSGATLISDPIGVEPTLLNSVSGANGVTLYFTKKVLNGVKYLLVTGLVQSDSAGSFNNIVLTDSSNKELPGQIPVSGNLGAGLTDLAQGSVFAILLPAPTSTQTVKLQTQEVSSTGAVSNPQISSNSAAVTLVNNQAIVFAVPGNLYLSESNTSDVVTITNSGNAAATLQGFSSVNNVNIASGANDVTLAPGVSTKVTFSLESTVGASGQAQSILTYNNGSAATTTQINVNQALIPPITPTGGLTFVIDEGNTFIKASADGAITRNVTITNTGNTSETFNSQTITLPTTDFTLSAAQVNSCSLNSVNTLTIGASCNLQISYNGSTATSSVIQGNIIVNYTYDGGSQTSSNTTVVGYQVTQSTASITLTPTTTNFGSILNNNVESITKSFTLTNSGGVSGTAITPSFSGSNVGLFNRSGGTCGTSLAAGESCTIIVRFGPTSAAAVSATASLAVSYNNQVSTVSAGNASLSGTVATAQTSTFSNTVAASSQFVAGNGSSGTPYQIQVGVTGGTLTYTFKNTSTTAAASNFYVSYSPAISQYAINTGSSTCPTTNASTFTLQASQANSCTLVFNMTPSSGANNFNATSLTLNWKDPSSPVNFKTLQQTGITYVNGYAAPAITITQSTTSIASGESFTVTAALTGGYSGTPAQNITLGAVTPSSTGVTYTYPSGSNCPLTTTASSCTIKVSTNGSKLTAESYTASVVNSNSVVPNKTSITFAIKSYAGFRGGVKAVFGLTTASKFSYITNFRNIANDGLVGPTLCSMFSSSGLLYSCQNLYSATLGTQPLIVRTYGTAINNAGTFIYFSTTAGTGGTTPTNSILKCAVNPTSGLLSTCNQESGGLATPSFPNSGGIDLNTSGNKLAIGTFTAGLHRVCVVNTNTGVLSGCGTINATQTGVTFNIVSDVAFSTDNPSSKLYLLTYVTTSGISTAQVIVCNVTEAGTTGSTIIAANSCSNVVYTGITTTTNLTAFRGIAVTANRVFITSSNNVIYNCPLTSGACSTLAIPTAMVNIPYGITVNGSSLYYVNYNDGVNANVIRCTINTTTGAVTAGSCVYSSQ